MMKLRDTIDKQKSKSLLSYKNGNIILVHLDRGKTQKNMRNEDVYLMRLLSSYDIKTVMLYANY